MGEHFKLPQRVQAEPVRQTFFWVHFGINLHTFECLNDGEFPVFILH